MGEAAQATTALLTEHLQYTPLSLIDDIINSVNTLVYQGISSLENGLIATPPARLGFKPKGTPSPLEEGDEESDYPDAKREIEEGLHQLETLLESTVDKNFDKFEIYVLRNVLSVSEELASGIRLDHYKGLSYPPRADDPNQESINILRRKVIESQRLRGHLEAEASHNDTMIANIKRLLHSTSAATESSASHPSQSSAQAFSFLTTTPSAKALNVSTSNSAKQPLTTNINFALSQLPALKELLADLRPKLATLQNWSAKIESAKAQEKEERREYIEQRTRLHLDRVTNPVSLGPRVAIPGRKVEPEEIQALEQVADQMNDT